MTDDILERAVNLIKAGDIDRGGEILVSLLKENRKLERAWAWLYACVKTDDQRIYCLKKVIEINPNHERANAALEKLMGKQITQQPVQADTLIQDPQGQTAKRHHEPKPSSKAKSRGLPAKKTTKPNKAKVATSDKFKVVFIKPKVIYNKPNDNPYAKTRYISMDFPEVDSAMFGIRLMIGGISITPRDYPRCIETGRTHHKSQCYICEFFSAIDCPIRRDPTILHEAKTLFAQNKRYWQEYQERRDDIVDTIYSELKEHGRPLHYEVLAKILRDRYPDLRLSPKKVVRIMGWHPEKFEWIDVGVYRAK